MATSLTEEIKKVEAEAKRKVADARSQAARIVSDVRDEVDVKKKEAKQEAFKLFKSRLSEVEAEAEKKAEVTVEEGKKEAQKFVELHRKRIDKVSSWVSEEVMTRYGRS